MKYEIMAVKEEPRKEDFYKSIIDKKLFLTIKASPDTVFEKLFKKEKTFEILGSGVLWQYLDTGKTPIWDICKFAEVKYELYKMYGLERILNQSNSSSIT